MTTRVHATRVALRMILLLAIGFVPLSNLSQQTDVAPISALLLQRETTSLHKVFLPLVSRSGKAEAASVAQAVKPFLWGAATSSYQVEGGIDCSNPSLPCNDYDYFNRDPVIHNTVAINSGNVGPAFDLAPAGIADNAWDPAVYKRDFDNAKLLGLNAFRISLEWSRIEPTAPTPNGDGTLTHHWDENAIQHYVDMVNEMTKRGLQPIVTLNHFTLPIWVLTPPNEGICYYIQILPPPVPPVQFCFPTDGDPEYVASLRGWDNEETINRYIEFVKKVVPYFKDKVDYWLTVNEPVGSMIGVGYIGGAWSPGFVFDGAKAKNVMHNLIVAHVRAYEAIKDCANNPDSCDDVDADGDGVAAQVGFAHAMGAVVAARPGLVTTRPQLCPASNTIAASNFDYFLNDYFVNAVTKGEEDLNYLNSACSDQGINVTVHEDWKNHLDFLGINYYRRFHVYHDNILSVERVGFLGGGNHNNLYGEPEPHELLNDLGWALYPQGLYDVIMRTKNKWNLPVMITENGLPERNDRNRAPYIIAHLRQIKRAMSDGANVIGYMHWSLMDNWELQDNYHPPAQFGLFHIDRSDSTLHRAITEGALAYQQVIAESRATSPTGAPTVAALDNAEAKFGELTSDGMQITPPGRTHGRFWEGSTSEGPITLYLGYVAANTRITGMIYWHNLRQWRNVDLLVDSQGPFLRENWFDDVAGAMTSRDIRVSYANGGFTFPGNSSYTAARIPGTGLWRWNSGDSPWGTDYFYVSKLEGNYAGKYLIFSSPGPNDTPFCGLTGCVPQVSGSTWKAFGSVEMSSNLRLNGTGREGEGLFDVSLALTDPNTGSSVGTTAEVNSGGFTVVKGHNDVDAPFRLTGYLAKGSLDPTDNNYTWSGERNGSAVSKFTFLESRGIFEEFPAHPAPIGGKDDQYWKENDPTSVMPLVNFSFNDNGHGGKYISWEAGGRSYFIDAGWPYCASPPALSPCTGTWSDISGRVANRISEQFPPVVADLTDRTIEGNAPAGANVVLAAPPTFDLDGAALNYTWTGDFPTVTGNNLTVFLSLGSHTVCVAVGNGSNTANRCATFNVVDTTPPAIQCDSPDGLWHATDVSIPCTASDISAGLANPADASFALSTHVLPGTQTANAETDTRMVCDAVGNCAIAGPIGGNKVDKKAPVITIIQPAQIEYVHSGTLTLDYAVDDDAGSGVNHFTSLLDGANTLAGHGLASGQAIDLLTELALGSHTFTISAVDNVGNANTAAVTFTIIVTADSIKEDVTHFLDSGAIKNAGLANSLVAKIEAAANARARGNCNAAANIYQALINELQAQSGKGVDATAVAIMMADAQYLITHCP